MARLRHKQSESEASVREAIGVVKARWSHRSAISSGFEVLALAAIAGVAGYLFGRVLPQLLGVAGITA